MEILGIDNILSQVGNLEEAIRFYESLGFVLKFKIPRINAALFNIGSEEPGLMLFEHDTPKPSRFWVEEKSALLSLSKSILGPWVSLWQRRSLSYKQIFA